MRRFLWKIILIVLLLAAVLVWWLYFKVYGEGERTGTLIKITRKGNVFKTIEGEMWLSCRQTMNAERFYFSITEKNLADSLTNLQDECVQVSYKQYTNTLPWRGDTRYVVTSFRRMAK
jgi:hypothetical protein